MKSQNDGKRRLLWKIKPPSPSDMALASAPRPSLQEEAASKPVTMPVKASSKPAGLQKEPHFLAESSGRQNALLSKQQTRGMGKPQRPLLKRAYTRDICEDVSDSPVSDVIDLESDKENARTEDKEASFLEKNVLQEEENQLQIRTLQASSAKPGSIIVLLPATIIEQT